MRVLAAGASGAIGTGLVAQLVDGGHQVIGAAGRGPDGDRGAWRSNAEAKRELGWELRYPSWRTGFAAAYASAVASGAAHADPAETASQSPSHPCT